MRNERERARERIKDAWGELEDIFIHRGPSAEWVQCAAALWKQIDAALDVPFPFTAEDVALLRAPWHHDDCGALWALYDHYCQCSDDPRCQAMRALADRIAALSTAEQDAPRFTQEDVTFLRAVEVIHSNSLDVPYRVGDYGSQYLQSIIAKIAALLPPERDGARGPQFELYRILSDRGIDCRIEWALVARSARSRSGRFFADIAVFRASRLIAVCECKSKQRELRGRQRENYDNCGVPYLVAGNDNIDAIADALTALVDKGRG